MGNRLLLISPGFHGYYKALARSFELQGYDVVTHCYDVTASRRGKAWNKARHELPARLKGSGGHLSADRVSARAIDQIDQIRPDVIVVIRGDIFLESFWESARAQTDRLVVWMYDEMRRTAFDAVMVNAYSRIATYSREDTDALRAAGIDALYLPLGFDSHAQVAKSEAGRGVVSFIGAPFAKREAALATLIDAGIPVKAWGRGWSDHPFDRARTWRIASQGVPNARDASSSESLSIMRNSVATLNIHGDQDGFTMRTFEASGVGALQFIDREDVAEFYDIGSEVLVYQSPAELIELARRALSKPEVFVPIRDAAKRRTLAEHTLDHRVGALEKFWG